MPPKKSDATSRRVASSGTSNPSAAPLSTVKLPLPTFLQVLNKTGGMPMSDAMILAKKVYPTHNSPAQLAELTAIKLIDLKVDDKDQRKAVLSAIRKAGYVKPPEPMKRKAKDESDQEDIQAAEDINEAGPSKPKTVQSPAKKQKRLVDQEPEDNGAFNFNEYLDEESLRSKSTHINRAPVMTAWATVVAERLGFKREEALSIGCKYISRMIKIRALMATSGRPVLETESGDWRGIVKGSPVEPNAPFGYIRRSFRQTMPWVMGAMRLLAESFEDPAELNKRGYDLYCEFRPENSEWGKKTEMRMDSILRLRRRTTTAEPVAVAAAGETRAVEQSEESPRLDSDGTDGFDGQSLSAQRA